MDLSDELFNINKSLATRGIKLRIEQRGESLSLRGPLPCRKFPDLTKNQRISLRLKANKEDLNEAEKIVHLVELQIKLKQFDWKNWIKEQSHNKAKKRINDPQEIIQTFEKQFFADPQRRRSISGTKTTWTSSYLPYFRRLLVLSKDMNSNIDLSLLNKTLDSYIENSRSRQQCATALGALAKSLDIELPENWRSKANGYGIHKANFRQLPSDDLIQQIWEKIPNHSWRMAYGLMATYGLRNHEIFFCDISSITKNGDKILRVLPNTKTGEHQVWPFHPEWVEFFKLEYLGANPKGLPKVNTDLTRTTLQQVGRRVAEQFRRYKLPLTPYDLRHAWAIRTIHIGLPDSVSARMMGHSVAIHTRTYHHWITRRDQQKAVDTALSKNST